MRISRNDINLKVTHLLKHCSEEFSMEMTYTAPGSRKTRSGYRNGIVELRQGVQYRPHVWTADWRPHPAVTRTVQYAADVASSRNGQQMSAKSLQRTWKHEIQFALLRRRAVMTRTVLPSPSARAEWHVAGIIDGALHHWEHVSSLDGGPRDHDHADSGTDTAIPDDDIASLAS